MSGCTLYENMMDDHSLLLLYVLQKHQKRKCSFHHSLTLHSWRLHSGKIRCAALLHPSHSPFTKLFDSGQDDALVTLCGFDHISFAALHDKFRIYYNQYSPYALTTRGNMRKLKMKSGRKQLMSSIHCLGLALSWTRTRGSYCVLQLIFGLTASSLSLWLRFSRRVLVKVLHDDVEGQVVFPCDDEIAAFQAAISAKYPRLKDCWGAMDGLKLLLERCGDDIIQNNFYNGWTHDHYVSNLFLFSPNGKIRACYINAPGCLHDSTLANAGALYEKVDKLYERMGAKIVVDSAFQMDDRQSCYKSYQNNLDKKTGKQHQNSQLNKQATSVRQLSEWGMRGLQGSFPRLKDRL